MITIILACSKLKNFKRRKAVQLPAIEAYNGRMFVPGKVIAERHGFNVLILSAKYKLITPETLIKDYDEVFDRNNQFNDWSELDPSLHGFYVGGQNYFAHVPDRFERIISPGAKDPQAREECRNLAANPALMVGKIEAHRAKFGA